MRRFLERVTPPHHTTEARFIEIQTVDDFLAFDAARRYALTKEVPPLLSREFEFEYLPDSEPHESEWLRCSNFVVRHRGGRHARGPEMLSEFDQIEATFGAEKAADLRKACRYLLRNQFAYSGDRGAATVYNTLTDARFRRVADELFDSLGYRVHRNAEEQWVGILLDDDDASSVPKMKLEETIIVLVLGRHWQEEADLGNLLDRATALTTVNVLHERYRDMVQLGQARDLGRTLPRTAPGGGREEPDRGRRVDRDAQDREVESGR